MIRYTVLDYAWMQLWHDRPERFWDASKVQSRMSAILRSWEHTPYMSGQDCKGTGADCIGFGFRVIDELYDRPTPERPKLPADTSMHNRKEAARTVHTLRKLYAPNERVFDRVLQPLDLLVTGPRNGGPGHLILVGPERNTLWQAVGEGCGVERCGWALPDEWRLFRVYRFQDRERWIPNN